MERHPKARLDAADKMQFLTFTLKPVQRALVDRYAIHHNLTLSMATRILLGKTLHDIHTAAQSLGESEAFDLFAENPGDR